jgi:hypothetical protein
MIVLACGVVSCGDDDDDDDAAAIDESYALDGVDAANWDAAGVYAATDSLDDPFFEQRTAAAKKSPTHDPEEAAAAAVLAADRYFSPKSCVDAQARGGEVKYDLSSCDGPLGIHKASGTITVKFSRPSDEDDGGLSDLDAGTEGDALAFDVGSQDLKIDGVPAELDASGIYSRTATGDKHVLLHSKGHHTRNGNDVERDVVSNAHWKEGSQCVDVDADGTLTTLGRTFTIEIDGYQRCAGDCPKAGTVRVVGARTVTLTLDGTDQPDFMSSNGTNGNVDLDCGS